MHSNVSEEKTSEFRNNNNKRKAADFETAVAATGNGKFHYLLFLAVIPATWAPNLDTSNISMILPSAECDLGLTLFHKGVLNAITYVGMVLSGLMWGYLADVRGRKNILIYGYMADGICNVLAGFSQNFWTLVVFKFVSGFIISGPYATAMSYCAEFYGVKQRPRILLLVGFFCCSGCVVSAALAWLVVPLDWSIVLWDGAFVYNSWRLYLSLCGLPTLFGMACLCFFPESPKFLMSQGRKEEAMVVFRKMYVMNTGKPANTYPITALQKGEITGIESPMASLDCPAEKKQNFREGVRQMKPLFKNPFLPRLILVLTIQFCGMSALNTFRLWQPQLFAIMDDYTRKSHNPFQSQMTFCEILDFSTQGSMNETAQVLAENVTTCKKSVVADSVYIQTTIVSVSIVVATFIASTVVNLLGNKTLLLISYGAALLCLISFNWSADMLLTLTLTCLFVGLMMTTLNVVVGTTVILFPTSLRTMAVSLGMMSGRVGSMIGNLLFPILLAYGCLAPLIALSLLTLICIILTLFIPKAAKNME